MSMRTTLRKAIAEMLKKKSKIIHFKSRMAPNDNIPANSLGILQKVVQWLG